MSVRRWNVSDHTAGGYCDPHIAAECPECGPDSGEYVLASDYDALAARLAEAKLLAARAINSLPCPTMEPLAKAMDEQYRRLFGEDTLGRPTASAPPTPSEST